MSGRLTINLFDYLFDPRQLTLLIHTLYDDPELIAHIIIVKAQTDLAMILIEYDPGVPV